MDTNSHESKASLPRVSLGYWLNSLRVHSCPFVVKPFWSPALLIVVFVFASISGSLVRAAETIPPPPKQYFNDYAGIISAQTVRELNTKLATYERTSSNQLLVAIFRRMESDSSVPDYTQRVAESWRVGQGKTDNGAVLFLFMESRDVYMQVGYGLEGAIPDVLAKRIIEEQIIPAFRSGNFSLGLQRGVDAMIAASQGEYTGSGRTVADGQRRGDRGNPLSWIFIVLIVAVTIISRLRGNRGYVYSGRGMRRGPGWWIGGGGGGFGGGGGGGGFSGGGGSFGGGGAGGRW